MFNKLLSTYLIKFDNNPKKNLHTQLKYGGLEFDE
jgi:hypothetical protein